METSKSRKDVKTMKIRTIRPFRRLIAPFLCALCLLGCAANPGQSSVVSKNDGNFEENMTVSATAPLEEALDYHLTFSSKDETVEYTLDISRDLTSQPLPIVEVVPDFFTGDDVQRIAQVLLPDAQWREQIRKSDPQYSQEELRYKIGWMSQLATPPAMADLYGDGDYDDYINQLKTTIQMYTVMLESAPEENPRSLCDWTFRDDGLYTDASGGKQIHATARVGELEYFVLCSVYDKADYHTNNLLIQLGNNRDMHNYSRLHAMVCRTEVPTQAQMDAVAVKAQSLLNAMGKGDWRVVSCNVETMERGSAPEYEILVEAVPEFLGVPISSTQPRIDLLADSTAPQYFQSCARLSFSADGTLVYLDMTSPVSTSNVINESAAILPMEELLEKAQEQLSFHGLEETRDYYYLYYYYEGSVTCQVELTDVAFGLQRIPVAGKDYTYYYVPALSFSGTTRYYDQATGAQVDCVGVDPTKVSTLL